MSPFRYEAYDPAGRRVSGRLQARDAASAVQQLRAQQLQVVLLDAEADAPVSARRRIGDADRVLLLQEFATLLGSGVTLAEAAPSLAQAYAGSALGPALQELVRVVRGGQSLAQGLDAAQLGLPRHTRSLVAAGEASGHLADALARAAEQLDHERQMRQQFRSALVYPAFLLGAGVVAVLFIFASVVPRFAPLLRSGRAEVPALSRWVIETGLALQANALWVALALGLATAGLVLLLRQSAVRQRLLDGAAGLPVWSFALLSVVAVIWRAPDTRRDHTDAG